LIKKESFNEIMEALNAVIEYRKQPILESEVRTMATRLVEYHGVECFRVIHALAEERYFPSAHTLENQVRAALGKPLLKGLTEDKIEKNERELVVSGQAPAKAKAGAEMMRSALRLRGVPVVEDPNLLPHEAPVIVAKLDPLAALEDFGPMDPLAALEEF
jgi:hypothetical protein